MHPEVEKLLRLQAIDGRLEILRKEIEARPQIVESQDSQVTGILENRAQCEAEIKRKTKEVDREKLEVATFDGKIEESKAKLNAVKSNEEFTALNNEIEHWEQARARHQEKMDTSAQERSEVEARLTQLDADLEEARTTLSEEEKEIQEELDEIREEATELITAREEAVGPITEEIMDQYSVLFTRYRERSVVPADNGVCTGCHITLSPQTINTLRSDNDVVICLNCSRILYI